MTPHLSVGRTVCTTRTVMLRDSAAGLELRNSERNSFPKQKARVYTRARPAADPGHADGLNRFQRGAVRIANRAVDGYIRVVAPSCRAPKNCYRAAASNVFCLAMKP